MIKSDGKTVFETSNIRINADLRYCNLVRLKPTLVGRQCATVQLALKCSSAPSAVHGGPGEYLRHHHRASTVTACRKDHATGADHAALSVTSASAAAQPPWRTRC